VQAVLLHALPDNVSQALQNILAAYFHTIPLNELIDSKDRSKRQEHLIYVTICGAACSSCLSEERRFERVRARAALFEDREAVTDLLFSQFIAILTENQFCVRLSGEAEGKLIIQ
jgi:hypothetical protein